MILLYRLLFVIGLAVANEGSNRLLPEALPFRPAVDQEDCVAGKGKDRGHSAAVVSPTGVFLSWCFGARFVGIPQDFPLPVDAEEEVEYPLHLCKIPVSSLPQVSVNCVTFLVLCCVAPRASTGNCGGF